jgi:NDP-sugar pyrophosphorylase family protein
MKAVILADGLGTRRSEETVVRPMPMVEIGGPPILWHILKIYSCCGMTGAQIADERVAPLGRRSKVDSRQNTISTISPRL